MLAMLNESCICNLAMEMAFSTRFHRSLFLMFLAAVALESISPAAAESAVLPVGQFSAGHTTDWEEKSFNGNTDYRLVQFQDRYVLKADSRTSASALLKHVRIDLQKFPYLNWKWRIDKYLDAGDERSKANDDYAARVYLLVDGIPLIWGTRALAYVWSNERKSGDSWPNAYVGDSAIMLSLRDRSERYDVWYSEKRNVYEDMKRFLGREVRYIDAVAVMTDSDDTKDNVISYYGDIYFSRQ